VLRAAKLKNHRQGIAGGFWRFSIKESEGSSRN
jgi:hypothetical protein